MDQIANIGGTDSSDAVQKQKPLPKVIKKSSSTPQQSTTSSIGPSEEVKKKDEPLMAAPILPPPVATINDVGTFITFAGIAVAQTGVSKGHEAAAANIQMQMSEIATGVLSKWVQSLQEMSVENTRQHAKKRAEEIRDEKIEENEEASEENASEARASGESFALSSLVLSGLIIPGVSAVSPSTMVPIAQAITALIPTGAAVMPAAFFSLVGVMASGAMLRAALQTFLSGAKEKAPINAEFVKHYSARILATINNSKFISTLSKLFPDKQELIPMAKLILLATALGLSYKAETGHMIGLDFLGLINGQITLPPKDPRHNLVLAFRAVLGGMKNPEQVKQRLAEYFDSNPSLENLLEPADALAGFFSANSKVVRPILGG